MSPAFAYLSGATAAALIADALTLPAVWADIIVFAAGQAFIMSNLCGSDPPTMPQFSGQDILDITTVNFIANPTAFAKLADLVTIGAWYAYCECSDQSAPIFPPNPVYPGGNQIVNPPGAQPLPAGACSDIKKQELIPFPAGSVHTFDYTAELVPTGPTLQLTGKPFTNLNPVAVQIPSGANHLTLSVTPLQAQNTDVFRWDLWDSAGATGLNSLQLSFANSAAGVARTVQLATPNTSAVWWTVTAGDNLPNQVVAESYTVECSFFCAGQSPSTPATPCCPPDPTLQARIDAIYTLLTIVQRQSAPFAYVHGATHSGLTGNGQIAVQGLLGVKVLPQTIPPDIGVDLGNPDVLWLESWINWGNADGWLTREWLRASPHVSLPPLPGQFTILGYSIRPGMAVDIVELVREP